MRVTKYRKVGRNTIYGKYTIYRLGGTVSKRRKHLKRIGFQKKCAVGVDTEIGDSDVVDVIDVDSSDDDIPELVGLWPEEEDVIVLDIEDGEEDPLTFFNGIISDVMNAMICKVEGSTFISSIVSSVA